MQVHSLQLTKSALFKIFQNPNKSYREKTPSALETLITMNPTLQPGNESNFKKYAKGLWRVSYAPHIRTLEKVLFTSFDVFYALDNASLESYVKFKTRLFGIDLFQGHLCASGTYGSLNENETTITWDQVWCDFNTFEQGPSKSNEISIHFLPQIVQPLGKLAFIKSVSKFPVFYLDNSLIVFEFSLLGTKIVAYKVNNKPLENQYKAVSTYVDE
jgi:hypothetical protein